MLKNCSDGDIPTIDLFVPVIISRIACSKHNADIHKACFTIVTSDGERTYSGICNSRAKRYGMNGQIRPASLRIMGTNKF